MPLQQDIICTGALTEEALSAAAAQFFRSIRPQRQQLFDYYHTRQAVPKGESVRGRPNNLLRAPFPRYITEVHTGYFLGLPPTLDYADPRDTQAFSRLSGELHLEHLLFDIGRDMSICGAGYALVWLEQSGLHACRCDPADCFTIRGGGAGSPVRATVQFCAGGEEEVSGVLYQPGTVHPFTWDGSRVRLHAPEVNLLRALPLIPFANNCQGNGDFEMVTGLVDAYNLLLSGAMDDMQSVANAFLALYGMQGTTQSDIDQANRSRVLSLAEGGKAEFVVKQLDHEALGQLESNLRRNILQLSMTPDLSDEQFAGNTSGVAMRYKLWGIEQVRAAKERSFLPSLQQLLTALSGALEVLGSAAALSSGKPTFYKNLPQDHTELASTLLSLAPVLSRRTILEQLPWVTDVARELSQPPAARETD